MAGGARIASVAAVALLATLHAGFPAIVAAPDEELAVADRAAPPHASDSPEDVLRRARNAHFDGTGIWPIDEDSYGGRLYAGYFPPYVPELPIKTSTTIVVAQVQRAAAFIAGRAPDLFRIRSASGSSHQG